ncbi:MAG: YHYH protein [Phycisphaerales bacterium]|nr:YHYH protein [Phycisphaerales bacterium]
MIRTHRLLVCPPVLLFLTTVPTLAHPEHEHPAATSLETTGAALQQPERRPRQDGVERSPQRMEAIELPDPQVSITIEGAYRVIRANGLPAHDTGRFPNAGNPNALRPQSHEVRLPLVPTVAAEPTPARPEFGIAINGVIFDAGTGEFWTADSDQVFGGGSPWNYEALGGGVPLGLDQNNAHVQPTGKYHYHGVPTGLVDEVMADRSGRAMIHIGWAYDGFPIYARWGYSNAADAHSEVRELRSSYRLKEGLRPARPDGPGGRYDGTFGLDYEYVAGLGDLDECNGRYGVTPEFPQGTYYYVVTSEFPSIPRMWRGEPSESVRARGAGAGPGGRPPGARPGERGPDGPRPRPDRQRRPDDD